MIRDLVAGARRIAAPFLARDLPLLRECGPPGGALVARTFHRVLAILFLVAFVSLAVQVLLLFGADGLAPIADAIEGHRRNTAATFFDLPTIFWISSTDGVLVGACVVGIALSIAALLGVQPRICAPVLAFLYLSFASVGAPFLSFQWDNLLVEAGFLAAFLPRFRVSRAAALLFVALAIKLYFESGVAKLSWGGEQWSTGEAMAYYYETAPLPGPLAGIAHRMPAWWHLVESRGIVVIELGVPWLFLGPRPLRLGASAILVGFQIVNVATANYGFFVWLTLALHLFTLDDAHLAFIRARTWDRLRPPRPLREATASRFPFIAPYAVYWLACSIAAGWNRFDPPTLGSIASALAPLHEPFRTANTYHLFGPITTRRIEAEFQVDSGNGFVAMHTHSKPGPLDRTGVWVQPHQPRVDFQLWFYGLSWRRSTPPWVVALLRSLCQDPARVQPLFDATLPSSPRAVRIVFWRYRLAEGGWTRTRTGETPTLPCQPQRDMQRS